MRNPVTNLVSMPWLWDYVQKILGAPDFKRELYRGALHPGSRLLDLGCASGHLAEAFLDFDYYGVDLDPHAIAAAQARFKDHPNLHFVAADMHARPFAAGYFDEVLFAATAHHLSDSLLQSLLREVHFCLKQGGEVHLFDPALQATDTRRQRFFRGIDQGKFSRSGRQIVALIEPLDLFEIGPMTHHPPYGAPLQDCDFVHIPLLKK